MKQLYKEKRKISNRVLSVIVFSLFFSWLLTFPFEGRILYGLANYYGIYAHSYVFGTIGAHADGAVADIIEKFRYETEIIPTITQ